MVLIKGIPVTLYERTQTGIDAFNQPIFEETPVTVENVLVQPTSAEDVATSTDLYGKKAEYILGIPKGDTHNWIDSKIEFFGYTFKSFGFPTQGIEELVPGEWNKKVMVAIYG